MTAFIGQDSKQVAKRGAKKSSWYCFWTEPSGARRQKSFGPGRTGKAAAKARRDRINMEIAAGTYLAETSWSAFVSSLLNEVVSQKGEKHAKLIRISLEHFERHATPRLLADVTTRKIDTFIRRRSKDRGRKKGDVVSPATVNRDLRNLRLALSVAVEWELLNKVPKIRFVKELKREPRFVVLEDLERMLIAAKEMAEPELQNVTPEAYWRCLILFAFLTGWRIEQIQSVHRDHVDFKAGRVCSKAKDNKGKRDVGIPLPAELLTELKTAWASFAEFPLRWTGGEPALWIAFGELQRHAGIHLECDGEHEHTPACFVYGFHDLRRSFATYNAGKMSPWQLQQLMQHKSLATTQAYIAMAEQLNGPVDVVLPESIRKRS